MTMRITPAILESAYEFLRTTRVIGAWKLPTADEVEFHVIRSRKFYGDHTFTDGKHVLRISDGLNGTPATLLATLSHEMAHMKQAIDGVRADVEHGGTFQKLAKAICRELSFDEKAF